MAAVSEGRVPGSRRASCPRGHVPTGAALDTRPDRTHRRGSRLARAFGRGEELELGVREQARGAPRRARACRRARARASGRAPRWRSFASTASAAFAAVRAASRQPRPGSSAGGRKIPAVSASRARSSPSIVSRHPRAERIVGAALAAPEREHEHARAATRPGATAGCAARPRARARSRPSACSTRPLRERPLARRLAVVVEALERPPRRDRATPARRRGGR